MREGPELSAAANSMRYVALGLVAIVAVQWRRGEKAAERQAGAAAYWPEREILS